MTIGRLIAVLLLTVDIARRFENTHPSPQSA
jgi:hypothetical protein